MNLKYITRQFGGLILSKMFAGSILSLGSTIILMYHRVTNGSENCMFDRSLYITIQSFEKNILFLLRNNFEIIGLGDWLKSREKNKKYCVITFDDGWRDNYENAFQVLRKYNLPATIFLTASFIDSSKQLWFDELKDIILYIYKNNLEKDLDFFLLDNEMGFSKSLFLNAELLYSQLVEMLKKNNIKKIEMLLSEIKQEFKIRLKKERTSLTWDEVELMSEKDISFGSHGVNHQIIPNLSPKQKKHEICSSKLIISEKAINFIPVFSFPNGLMDQESIDMAFDSGYISIVSASYKNHINASPLIFHRICTSEYLCGGDNKLAMRLFLARLRNEYL